MGYCNLYGVPKYVSFGMPELTDEPMGKEKSIMMRLCLEFFFGRDINGDVATNVKGDGYWEMDRVMHCVAAPLRENDPHGEGRLWMTYGSVKPSGVSHQPCIQSASQMAVGSGKRQCMKLGN